MNICVGGIHSLCIEVRCLSVNIPPNAVCFVSGLAVMKSIYLTLLGSVRNEVSNRDLVGATISKITGSQPGTAFLSSVLLVGTFQK